eukprot:jgi/Botrbrau1/20622/Bobra.113_1s0047.1
MAALTTSFRGLSLRVKPFAAATRRLPRMQTKAELTLYTNPRSRGKILEWYLEELGTPYARNELSYEARDHKADWFLKINPMGKLPALTDGDLKLFESGALLLYVADKYDPSVTTPEQRALAAQWVLFANATLGPGMFDPAQQEKQMEGIMNALEVALQGQDYLVDNKFSVSDVAIGSYLLYCLLFYPQLDYSPWPNVKAYVERLKSRPKCTIGK